MNEAATTLAFERAARIRDKIQRLQQLQSRQFVESATAGDIDVVAATAENGVVALNVVMIRGGRHVGDRTFFPQHADASALGDVVRDLRPPRDANVGVSTLQCDAAASG